MSVISRILMPGVSNPYDIQAYKALSIPLGYVDVNSTSTAFAANISGIRALYDGLVIYLANEAIASNGAWTLNINNLGAKPVYLNNSATHRSYIDFQLHDTYMLVYNSTKVSGGCWTVVLNNAPLIIPCAATQLFWRLTQMYSNTLNQSITPINSTWENVWNELELASANGRELYLKIQNTDNVNQFIILPFAGKINSTYYFSLTERFFASSTSQSDVGLMNINVQIFLETQGATASATGKIDYLPMAAQVTAQYNSGTKIATILGTDIYVPWTDGDSQAYGGS